MSSARQLINTVHVDMLIVLPRRRRIIFLRRVPERLYAGVLLWRALVT